MKTLSYLFFAISLLCGCGSDSGETKPPVTAPDPQANPSNPANRFELTKEQIAKSVFCPENTNNTVTPTANSYRVNDTELNEMLNGPGLKGWVHGSVPASGQYVLSYRNPSNFFQAEEFNLTATRPDLLTKLKDLSRHDAVTVLGSVLPNTGPVRHILINDLVTITQYANDNKYSYSVDESIFDNLEQVKLLVNVHAIIDKGKALALEYEDIILPVLVEDIHLDSTTKLYRNDKIIAELRITRSAGRPLHFRTNKQTPTAIRVIDAMENCHNNQKTLTGELVKFSKSPQINRDVYAVKITDDNNINRIFTFFPDFASDDEFTPSFDDISQKAEAIWLNNTATVKKGRNYLINPKITVSVTGKMNIVSRSQANPQIYISNINSLTFN